MWPLRGLPLRRPVRRLSVVLVGAVILAALVASTPGISAPARQWTAAGTGGAIATADGLATEAGLDMLRRGGNAFDAAVTAAAVLGVTEPFSCGLGGGGFLVGWTVPEHEAITLDHREKGPESLGPDSLIDPDTGEPFPHDELVTSGLGVGVPGTVAGWARVLRRYGTLSLADVLGPAIRIARDGFLVDQAFHDQIAANRDRFADITSTRALFLTAASKPLPVGHRFRNPDLAATMEAIAEDGSHAFYAGPVARDLLRAVTDPPVRPGAKRTVRPGGMTQADLTGYTTEVREPVPVDYRGYQVIGMGPPSSGGTTVGEALQILEGYDLTTMGRPTGMHRLIEAARLAFADRNVYLGDPDFVDVPVQGLTSAGFGAERRSVIGDRAGTSPAPPGDPYRYNGSGDPGTAHPSSRRASRGTEGPSTTHLTVSDKAGNVVSYTYTIEEIGGSGIVVPNRGFLLNNQLADFEPEAPHANSPAAGKRPRSSMAPTIVLRDNRPVLALGSPGGATIITTVLQLLVDVLDYHRPLPDALAAPRATQQDRPATDAEQAYIDSPEGAFLKLLGHELAARSDIGAAAAIAFGPGDRVQAVAEPTRRGGGTAAVERPARGMTPPG